MVIEVLALMIILLRALFSFKCCRVQEYPMQLTIQLCCTVISGVHYLNVKTKLVA